METYLNETQREFSPINLMTEIHIRFINETNSLPSDFEFEEFIRKVKGDLIDRTKRLSIDEKTLLFDNLIINYNKEYRGCRKYFLEQIQFSSLYSLFPEYKDKKEFELSNEQILRLENEYSLYPHFQRMLNQLKVFIEKLNNNLNTPQQTETETEQETPTFTNAFDNIKPTEIYKHFKAGLVEKGYLTEQELNAYLKAAFELKEIPETLFKIKDAPNKAAIEAVFYRYYKNVAGKIHGKQNQYAALLGDYFEGYKTTTVSSNFSKSVY